MAHNEAEHNTPEALPSIDNMIGAGNVRPETSRHAMERSFSQDIQEGSQELKEAAEQTRNIILDLSLDGIIRWVSPSWADVLGTQLETVKGKPIREFIHDNPDVFDSALAALKSNDQKSQFVKFAVEIGASSDLQPMLRNRATTGNDDVEKRILELDAQGIMVYDRANGSDPHVSYGPLAIRWQLMCPDDVDVTTSNRARSCNDLSTANTS